MDVAAQTVDGIALPPLVSRHAETTVEMARGETLVMAGLDSETTEVQIVESSVGAALGGLAPRGRSGSRTNLVALVTVGDVGSADALDGMPLPGETYREPTGWERGFLDRVEAAPPSRARVHGASWLGGLERLRGPGLWATHERGVVHSRPEATRLPPADAAPSEPDQEEGTGEEAQEER